MAKVTKATENKKADKAILSSLLPKDAFSETVMLERAKLLSMVEQDDHTVQDSMIHYIQFIMGNHELYGIAYNDVQDVKTSINITNIPMAPNFVIGVSYWHGKLIPIVDLALYFGITSENQVGNNRIIATVANDKSIVGFAFNDVTGVDAYLPDTLDKNISVNVRIKEQYINGIHKGKTAILNVKNIVQDVSAELMKKGKGHE